MDLIRFYYIINLWRINIKEKAMLNVYNKWMNYLHLINNCILYIGIIEFRCCGYFSWENVRD